MRSSPPEEFTRDGSLLWFTVPVIIVGMALLGQSVVELTSTPYSPAWLSLVAALALLSSTFTLKVPGIAAQVSISETFFFTAVLLFGPAPATVTIALDSLLISWRRGHSAHQLWFNPTSSAASLWAGAHVYYLLATTGPLADADTVVGAETLGPLAALVATYFLLNSGLTCVAVALEKGTSPLKLWRQHFAILSISYFAAASATFFLIVMWRYAGITAIAAVTPVICICYVAMRSWLGRAADTEKHLSAMNRLYLSTIGAFSTAIEAKDGVTCDHIHRVHAYALGLARAMRITDTLTLEAIEAAALLHDTGKLAVPEHILNKPGKLTPAEFETMKLHVDVGVDILSSIEFPYPVVPIVRAHHENWDGSGYPAGVRGEDIPIGARILSVVDCYDALTSDRPYRSAMTDAEALEIIIQRRGTMYDPAVVDVFLRVYRDIAPAPAQRPELQRALGRITGAHAAASRMPAAALASVAPVQPEATSSEECLALMSLARVVSEPPSVADVGLLAWGQLRRVAPGSTLALYTVDAVRGSLVATYTAGPAALQLRGHTMAVGERISGWAAASVQAMVNAPAGLDFRGGHPEGFGFATALPLTVPGVLAGVMTLYGPQPIPDDCARNLETISPSVATLLAAASGGRAVPPAPRLVPVGRVHSTPSELRLVAKS